MAGPAVGLSRFLTVNRRVISVALTRVRGSSPREAGTEMFVAATASWGTIGGGQLEFRAIEAARRMLDDGQLSRVIDLPLGPEIGQCCGGRVEITLRRMRASDRRAACLCAEQAAESRPHVYILGAGHVGRALADLFQPEFDVAQAPTGSAFIVLTHDHALDFLVASRALERGDATYVGMIGSATKRASFKSWMRENSDAEAFDGLTCPIGAGGSRDKRPSVIAAFVVAEVMAKLTAQTATQCLSQTPARGEHTDRAEARS